MIGCREKELMRRLEDVEVLKGITNKVKNREEGFKIRHAQINKKIPSEKKRGRQKKHKNFVMKKQCDILESLLGFSQRNNKKIKERGREEKGFKSSQ